LPGLKIILKANGRCFFYRTVDKENNTVDFPPTGKRDEKAAERVFYQNH
jgi:transposase-like protein